MQRGWLLCIAAVRGKELIGAAEKSIVEATMSSRNNLHYRAEVF